METRQKEIDLKKKYNLPIFIKGVGEFSYDEFLKLKTLKICNKCGDTLDIHQFRLHKSELKSKFYILSKCFKCDKKQRRQYYYDHPEWVTKQNSNSWFSWRNKLFKGIKKCQVCGEKRTLDISHIVPLQRKSKGYKGPRHHVLNNPENILVLCPTHHRLFDEDKLNEKEFKKIQQFVEIAKGKYENE